MNKVLAIALTTCRESIRSRVLYALFFFAVLLVLVSAMFGTVTIGDQLKVIKDFGLFSICFFSVAYAVIAGAAFVHKELARKTVYNILAKPVRRWEFLCGKYLGMLATVALMTLLMGAGLLTLVYLCQGGFDLILLQALIFIFLQLIIVCACTIFFSAIVITPMLSGAFSFGIFLAGRSTEYLLYFVSNQSVEGLPAAALKACYLVLPHLDLLDISNQAVYGQAVALSTFVWSGLYALGYAGILLVLASFIFRNREFN